MSDSVSMGRWSPWMVLVMTDPEPQGSVQFDTVYGGLGFTVTPHHWKQGRRPQDVDMDGSAVHRNHDR